MEEKIEKGPMKETGNCAAAIRKEEVHWKGKSAVRTVEREREKELVFLRFEFGLKGERGVGGA